MKILDWRIPELHKRQFLEAVFFRFQVNESKCYGNFPNNSTPTRFELLFLYVCWSCLVNQNFWLRRPVHCFLVQLHASVDRCDSDSYALRVRNQISFSHGPYIRVAFCKRKIGVKCVFIKVHILGCNNKIQRFSVQTLVTLRESKLPDFSSG